MSNGFTIKSSMKEKNFDLETVLPENFPMVWCSMSFWTFVVGGCMHAWRDTFVECVHAHRFGGEFLGLIDINARKHRQAQAESHSESVVASPCLCVANIYLIKQLVTTLNTPSRHSHSLGTHCKVGHKHQGERPTGFPLPLAPFWP